MGKPNLAHRLPARPEVTNARYHRGPTAYEVLQGYGGTHYRCFPIEEVCHKGTRIPKRWIKADDGLRYYR
jgi:hypothetical protein